MTCIKFRLSNSLFFLWLTLTFPWEFNFNDSFWTLEEYVRCWILCALGAMVRKLISLICSDICQSKWYRNALIGVPDDKTNSEKRLLRQTLHVRLKNVKTDQGYHAKSNFSRIPAIFKEPLQLNSPKAKWRLFNTATIRCDGFATVFTFDDVMPPADHYSICDLYFWWFRRDSLHVTPQASSTIRHNIEIFRVMLSNLMFR